MNKERIIMLGLMTCSLVCAYYIVRLVIDLFISIITALP